jgi:hypothetical protein
MTAPSKPPAPPDALELLAELHAAAYDGLSGDAWTRFLKTWDALDHTLLAMRKRIEELERRIKDAELNTEMAGGCLSEIRGFLESQECCHGKPHPGATPPMMYREWIMCVMAKQQKRSDALEAENERLRELVEGNDQESGDLKDQNAK